MAGVAPAVPSDDYGRFDRWRSAGFAGEMTYLTDGRGDLRSHPRRLLESAESVVCVGKIYNSGPGQQSPDAGVISRYAQGADYHEVLRESLAKLVRRIAEEHTEPFEYRICVDTAPLLERSYASQAGLGWIGRNTCLINQTNGSWLFLGELLLSIPLSTDEPVPNRCGTCTRCIQACPTEAIVANERGEWQIDARLCISYLTIEKRGLIHPELAVRATNHLFGCDICQDVCPWNRKAPLTDEPAFHPALPAASLADLATLTEEDFRNTFRRSPIWRAKYSGFLRNVAGAIGNAGRAELLPALDRLIVHSDPVIAEAAIAGRERLLRSLRQEAEEEHSCESCDCVVSS